MSRQRKERVMGILVNIIIALVICLIALVMVIINIAVATSIEAISLIDIFGFIFLGLVDLTFVLFLIFATIKILKGE